MMGVVKQKLSENAKVIIPSALQTAYCTSNSHAYIVTSIPGTYSINFHNGCQHNEILALYNRHLIDRSYIAFDKKYWKIQSLKVTRSWVFKPDTITYKDVAMSYQGGKRRVYMRARENLLLDGLRKSDGYIKMFVKPDRYSTETVHDKMPRAIQYRSPKFNMELATFLKPYEHHFYAHPGLGPSGTRVVTKGLNPTELADLFILKSAQFRNPIYVSLDHSKFDSTVREEHLKTEHNQYMRAFPHKRGKLYGLLRQQLLNRGFTRNGIKYSIRGTRMSGDYNTGLGNCLLNRIVLESWLMSIKHEIMLDGDDSVVIIEADDFDKLDTTHFTRMGFETKIDYTCDMTEVVYCQKRIVLAHEPVMVRDPLRALSNMALCLANVQSAGILKWLRGVIYGEYMVNFNMPIYCAFEEFLDGKIIKTHELREKIAGVAMRRHTKVERYAFEQTWGISDGVQLHLEQTIRTHFHSLFTTDSKYVNNKNDDAKEKQESYRPATGSTSLSALHTSANQSWDEHSTQRIQHRPNAFCVTPITATAPG